MKINLKKSGGNFSSVNTLPPNQTILLLDLSVLFFNSGIQKKVLTGISGIKNGIRIPLPMGVPEIGTKNWNSQPSLDAMDLMFVTLNA
jgi:hypothetical protein